MPETNTMEATFSILIMSIASSAAMAMDGDEKDKNMARFNIDLLMMLQEKTKSNLSEEEKKFLASLINDLQIKFVQT